MVYFGREAMDVFRRDSGDRTEPGRGWLRMSAAAGWRARPRFGTVS